MATYVLLKTLTPEGRQTLHAHPERVAEVNQAIAKFGCRVLQQYALLGAYDFLTVVEAPDNATVSHLSVDLGSRGTVGISTGAAGASRVWRSHRSRRRCKCRLRSRRVR